MPLGRTLDDLTDTGVAVFHRSRKLAFLEWRSHLVILRDRHVAAEDQRFSAATDAGVAGLHQYLPVQQLTQRGLADLPVTRRLNPKLLSDNGFGHW